MALQRPRRHRWRNILVVAGVVLLALAGLFYIGGGWYFSGVIENDALVVSQTALDEFPLEVTAVTDDTITLEQFAPPPTTAICSPRRSGARTSGSGSGPRTSPGSPAPRPSGPRRP
jgi:hypothetical protein